MLVLLPLLLLAGRSGEARPAERVLQSALLVLSVGLVFGPGAGGTGEVQAAVSLVPAAVLVWAALR